MADKERERLKSEIAERVENMEKLGKRRNYIAWDGKGRRKIQLVRKSEWNIRER